MVTDSDKDLFVQRLTHRMTFQRAIAWLKLWVNDFLSTKLCLISYYLELDLF